MKALEVTYDDHPVFVGRRLRIKNKVETFDGEMRGIDPNSLIATGPTTSLAPWVLRLDDGTTRSFLPSAWEILDPAASRWRDQ